LNAKSRAPPRRTKVAGRSNCVSSDATTVPLEQLWMRMPSIQQQETLRRLSQMLAQRLAAHEHVPEAGLRSATDRDATPLGREVSDE